MLLKDKFIFVVEDNLQNRVIFQLLLIRQGARIEFERSGEDAIRRLTSFRHVDLIILDLALANGITGYDVFDSIRELHQYDAIPIVAVSATDPAVALPIVQSKGFQGFIAKPIDDVLFPRQMAKLIEGEKVWYMGSPLD
jgi:CheY-like chemotaxis protein